MEQTPEKVPAGYGPPWERVKEMPAPPPFNWKNLLTLIGPGVILLKLSIGSGEWLMGPASVLQYGTYVLWIVTIGILTQSVFNLMVTRYTLYCGEPIMVGLTRLAPGRWLWTPVWVLISIISVGPGWAAASATALAAMFLGRMPGNADKPMVLTAGLILFFIVIIILMIGGKIERTLEVINKILVAFIFGSLIILVIMFAPFSKWIEVFTGFFQFGKVPPGKVDWFLLAGLAGYAGAGGILNMGTSNWYRDKGYGMGSIVGYIPALIGGTKVNVSPVGKVPPTNETTIQRFKEWWKYLLVDQLWIWSAGCFIGMYLTVLLAYAMVPPGTKMGGWAVAAYQAEAVSKVLGSFGWYWLLFIGFWVLFGTQLAASETFVRQMTDLLWSTSPWAREKLSKNDIRVLYYTILVVFVLWSIYMAFKGAPLFLVTFQANAANLAFTVGGLQLLFVEKLISPELRSPLWAKLVIVVLVIFYGSFTVIGFGSGLFGWFK